MGSLMYVYLPSDGPRPPREMSEEEAMPLIGRRAVIGWPTYQRFVICRDGLTVSLVWTVNIQGRVFGLWYPVKGW